MTEKVWPKIDYFVITAAILLVVLVLFWTFAAVSANDNMIVHRLLISGFMVFFLPGLLLGEAFGFRSDHPLLTLAQSLAISISIEAIFFLFLFLFSWTLDVWAGLVLGSCGMAAACIAHRIHQGGSLNFLTGLVPGRKDGPLWTISRYTMLFVVAILCWSAFQWGDNLFDIESEKLIHLQYIRKYFSLPFRVVNFGTIPNSPPPNIIQLWEALIAGWAKMGGLDPAVVFFRSRVVIPVAAVSSMYMLVRTIYNDKRKSEYVFWGVILLALAGLFLYPPSSLDWINKTDPTRLATSFIPTAHHGDSAMDILLPLGSAMCLMVLAGKRRRAFVLVGVLAVIFLWHPREYFQVGIYFGIITIIGAGAALRNRTRPDYKSWLIVMAAFFVIVIASYASMKSFTPPTSVGYDEIGIKKAALKGALSKDSVLGIRNLFHFPLHFALSSSNHGRTIPWEIVKPIAYRTWHFDFWLFLTVFSVPILSIFGEREDRWLAWFFVLTWLMTAAWDFGMLLTIFLTYSEILITIPRFVYIFSYIMIPAAILSLFRIMNRRRMPGITMITTVVLTVSIALVLNWWFMNKLPQAKLVSYAASGLLAISLVVSILLPVIEGKLDRRTYLIAFLALSLCCITLLHRGYVKTANLLFRYKRPAIQWYTNSNPFGYSQDLIKFVQGLQPGRYFAIDPITPSAISVYAPHFEMMNIRTFMASISERQLLKANKHPLYSVNPLVPGTDGEKHHQDIVDWFDKGNYTHIVVRGKYYEMLTPYFQRHPSEYKEVFNNHEAMEVVYSR